MCVQTGFRLAFMTVTPETFLKVLVWFIYPTYKPKHFNNPKKLILVITIFISILS